VYSNTAVPREPCRRRWLVGGIAAIALLAAAPTASAATRLVPAQYPTLAAAYAAAQPGDTIELASGVHPGQAVPAGSKPVTFHGAPGAKVRTLENSASNVTFDGIEVDAGMATTTVFENHGADNVTFKNAAIGNVTNEKGALVSGTNFTFDNVLFHDAVSGASGVHMECVYALSVERFTVRNSTFRDCAVMDLFFTYGDWWSPLPPAYGHITIENNVFMHPEENHNAGWHYYGLFVANNGPNGHRVLDGWVVRNNTFETAVELPDSASGGSRWVGNIGSWDCTPGVNFRHNVGKKCGATDKAVNPAASNGSTTAAVGWINPAAGDFRLKPGSPAIDAGDPSDAPALDRNGYQRDARPDAGAHEFGAGPPAAGGGGSPGSGQPGGPASPQGLRSAKLSRRTICRRPKRGCPASVKLRLRVRAPGPVNVRIDRLRRGKETRKVRAFAVNVAGKKTVRIRGRKLAVGRYRVVVRTKDAAGQTTGRKVLKLRVAR
jgi:hypothetical protein